MATPIPQPIADDLLLTDAREVLRDYRARSTTTDERVGAVVIDTLIRRYAQYSVALDLIARWDETPAEERSARNVTTIAKVARGPLP